MLGYAINLNCNFLKIMHIHSTIRITAYSINHPPFSIPNTKFNDKLVYILTYKVKTNKSPTIKEPRFSFIYRN